MKLKDSNGIIRDKSVYYSVGVILKRALVQYLGIDDTEIGFGIKDEGNNNACYLFLYDTNKGGCNYVTQLNDSIVRNDVLSIALNLLQQSSCSCEQTGGACVHCLLERTNTRIQNYLSKKLALDWLTENQKSVSTPPATISAIEPAAKNAWSFSKPKQIVEKFSLDKDVTKITFCAEDAAERDAADWLSVNGDMGRLVDYFLHNGAKVDICLSYDNTTRTEAIQKIEDSVLPSRFTSVGLIPVLSLESKPGLKSCLIIEHRVRGTIHFFIESSNNTLPLSENWGEQSCNVYYTEGLPSPTFTTTKLPTLIEVTDLMATGNILNCSVNNNTVCYISRIVSDHLLKDSRHFAKAQSIIGNKNVDIEVSDSYICSPLACLMLVEMIKELKSLFNISINQIVINWSDVVNNYLSSQSPYFFYDFNDASDTPSGNTQRMEYMEYLINKAFPEITPSYGSNVEHHRWMKISTQDGHSVEIRFDHSIAGGWRTFHYERFYDMKNLDEKTEIKVYQPSVQYYVIFE